jgi:hypothetical protein
MIQVGITLSIEMYRWVEARANRLKIGKGKVIRAIIEEQMKMEESKP